jgi:hypothetical protein
MARRATIQLKLHRQVVQSIPLDEADIECLIQGLRLVTPCTQRIDRLIVSGVPSPPAQGRRDRRQ